jgi:hypothetical protein
LPTVSDIFSVACGELRFIEHQATSTQGAGRRAQGARSKEQGAERRARGAKDYRGIPSLWHLRLELSGNSIAQAFMSGIIGNIRSPGIYVWDYLRNPSLWLLRMELSGNSIALAFAPGIIGELHRLGIYVGDYREYP